MVRTTVFCISLLLTTLVHSQIAMFAKEYTAPFATCRAMDVKPGRGVLIAGTCWTQSTSNDITVIHADSLGALVWSRTFGTSNAEYVEDIRFTTDGGFILTGYQYFSLDSAHMIAMKFDAAGTILWSHNYRVNNYCAGFSCVESTDGGYAFFGYSYTGESMGGPYHATLIRTDVNGNMLWSQTYFTGQGMDGLCVRATPDGGFMLGARSFRGSFDAKVLLIKTDANGTPQWTREFGSANDEVLQAIEPLPNGSWIVGGYTSNISNGSKSAFLMKVDSTGNALWIRSYTAPSGSRYDCTDVTVMSDGGFAFVGQLEPQMQSAIGMVTRTDSNGSVLTNWHCPSPFGWRHLYEIQSTVDGGCVIGGDDDPAMNYHFCLGRTEDDGTGICAIAGPVLTFSAQLKSDTIASISLSQTASSGNFAAIMLPDSVTQQTVCTNVGQEEIARSTFSIAVFPNPACDIINLSFTAHIENAEIQLINSLGETVILEKEFSGTDYHFNAAELSDGFYIIRALVDPVKQCSVEFVKQSN